MKFSKQSVILVTGASQGIGYAVAEGFAKAGYRVIGVARNLPKTKPMFDAQIMDVTQAQSIQTVLTYIKSTYKQLDVLMLFNIKFVGCGPNPLLKLIPTLLNK